MGKLPPLNVNIKRTVSNGQVCELITYDEYVANKELYSKRNDIGISMKFKDTDIVLPLRNDNHANPISPGVYNGGCVSVIIEPEETNYAKYIPEKIITISNKSEVKDIIESGEEMKHLDEPFITTPDEITQVPIRIEDQPEMRCLKEAINSKNMDLDKYSNRFGSNYPNDKRQLKNTSATLNIIKRFCANMDMEALLTLRDKSPDVPNPIGREITVSLTDGYSDEDNES
jgi:hypothetical protein